jgi:hypothetical protein
MTKKILLVVFSAIILAGLTLMFNLENKKVGTVRYHQIEYTEKLESANATLLSQSSSLTDKLAALKGVFEYTKLANALEENEELSNEAKAIVKIFTTEELKQTLRYANMAAEEYDQSTSVDPVLTNFKAEMVAITEYVNSQEKEVTLTQGVLYSVFCITVVFGVLVVLWFIISSFKFLNGAPEKQQTKEEKVEVKEERKPLRLEDITDPDMMVAALVATIDYSNSGARDVKLVNIKKVVE